MFKSSMTTLKIHILNSIARLLQQYIKINILGQRRRNNSFCISMHNISHIRILMIWQQLLIRWYHQISTTSCSISITIKCSSMFNCLSWYVQLRLLSKSVFLYLASIFRNFLLILTQCFHQKYSMDHQEQKEVQRVGHPKPLLNSLSLLVCSSHDLAVVVILVQEFMGAMDCLDPSVRNTLVYTHLK